jgi:hypothetical protein
VKTGRGVAVTVGRGAGATPVSALGVGVRVTTLATIVRVVRHVAAAKRAAAASEMIAMPSLLMRPDGAYPGEGGKT